jgi:membrane protein implicated in regulation of membrane protease activity
MSWWIWVLAGFLLLAIEMASTTMHVGVFAVGAFVVAILAGAGLNLPFWGQLLVFAGVSLFGFLFLRPMLMRKLKIHSTRVVENITGEHAVVLEDIPPASRGRAELRGATWSATNIGSTPLARGQRCVVDRVDGLTLEVRAS